ncbi:MAG: extracellular solute-binding protein [Acidocella sp.]|nr:extracellular solute-binding protein [Acidocella sp.]
MAAFWPPPTRLCTRRPSLFYKILLIALLFSSAQPALARDDLITLSTAPQPPVGFTHLPYANPDAPKGGSITLSAVGDFDNLNPFILRGTAPDSIYRVWQTLFKQSDADSVTVYADLAQSVEISPDGLTVTFHLNPNARFSDGTKVLASDVVWTFNTLITQGSPFYASYYAGVASVAAPDNETVVFTLKPGTGRDMPNDLAGLYVLPEHFWKGKDFSAPLLTAPIGSGPYQVAQVSFGNSITYTRVKHWWAENLPADKGFDNFDTYREVFFQNDSVALQAFKAGQIDARIESSAKQWASGYHFPGVTDGKVMLVRVPVSLPAGIDGWAMNTRRPAFANPLVRHALTLAFDFQWMNRVLFYGSYVRYNSYFSQSFLASSGLPSPDELKLLAPYKNQIPPAVFTTPFALPVTDGSGYNLPQLEQAMALLNQAGWHVVDGKLVNAQGQQMSFEILLDDQLFERIVISYAADLKLLGINAVVRTIDPATYERRIQRFDYDMTIAQFPESDYPGSEQSNYWGCAAANTPGSNNLMGICSPAIDAMIKAQNEAATITQKITAIHALDRLLLNGWYLIPAWNSTTMRVAYWTRVVKQPAPLQDGVDFDLWWAP